MSRVVRRVAPAHLSFPWVDDVLKEWEAREEVKKDGEHKDKPQDDPSVTHVYTYIQPILHDGVILQMRDRPRFKVGLFGGELELWRKDVRELLRKDAVATFKGNMFKELYEESCIQAPIKDIVLQFQRRRVAGRSCWKMIQIVGEVTMPHFGVTRAVHIAPFAPHFGTETIAVIPVKWDDRATCQACIDTLSFHDNHKGMFLRCRTAFMKRLTTYHANMNAMPPPPPPVAKPATGSTVAAPKRKRPTTTCKIDEDDCGMKDGFLYMDTGDGATGSAVDSIS